DRRQGHRRRGRHQRPHAGGPEAVRGEAQERHRPARRPEQPPPHLRPERALRRAGPAHAQRGRRAAAPRRRPAQPAGRRHAATRPATAKTRMEIEVSNKFLPGPITVYNTVGELRGSEKADEFVVVGAHLDSWDLGQGTTDNGTGTCVVLETARLLARSAVKPK